MCLQHIIRMVSGWSQEQVSDFHGELWEGADNIVEHRLLCRDTFCKN